MAVETENIFRALGDKPLLAEKQWRCKVGIHSWLPWTDPTSAKRGLDIYLEQFRSCGHCNKSQRKVLSKN